jgi:hypothetical protein
MFNPFDLNAGRMLRLCQREREHAARRQHLAEEAMPQRQAARRLRLLF